MTETTKPTIKRGDSGPAVVELQRLLLGLVADGIFGAKTEAAVRRFQERRGMPATGIADAATWAALLPKSAAAPAPAPQAVLAGDLEGVRFVQAKSYRAAGRSAVDLVVIHTMEASKTLRTAENVAAWFAGKSAPEASAHYCVDADSIVQCVLERDVAHHAPGANRTGIGVELAGYARQTPADWDDPYNREMLARAAELVAGICARWSIPVVHLTPAELVAGGRGIVGHADCTAGFRTRGGHMDPGPSFPWSAFLEAVRAAMPSP